MKIYETISFEQLNAFDFTELDDFKSFTHSSRLFEILDNGTYVVGGFVKSTKKFHLITLHMIQLRK